MKVEDVNEFNSRRGPARMVGCLGGALLLLTGLVTVAIVALVTVQTRHRETQLQTDSHVASAWIAGVTFGPNHILRRGTEMQHWFNVHGVHALGDYEVLRSSFSGQAGGMEIWLDYRSYLDGKPLECHRVGPTAFIDDLGQRYHGFLDLQSNRTVGVYLPGYDHLARQMTCTVHWMPRRPAIGFPISRPMEFTVDLPPSRRILPQRADLSRGAVKSTVGGVTATVSDCRLGPADTLSLGYYQRSLTFRLQVEGGTLASPNAVFMPFSGSLNRRILGLPFGASTYGNANSAFKNLIMRLGPSPFSGLPNTALASSDDFQITDPYGVSLLIPGEPLAPMSDADATAAATGGRPAVWCAAVNGAGRGTDVVRLRFAATPNAQRMDRRNGSGGLQTAAFDILVPVQTGDDL